MQLATSTLTKEACGENMKCVLQNLYIYKQHRLLELLRFSKLVENWLISQIKLKIMNVCGRCYWHCGVSGEQRLKTLQNVEFV